MLTIITAIDQNGVISYQGQLPWHLPNDLKRFKKVTVGYPVVMGRKTYDSIGKSLDKRLNIVLSKQTNLKLPGCWVFNEIDDVLKLQAKFDQLFIVGGQSIYEQFLPYAEKMLITRIKKAFTGDCFFPQYDPSKWYLSSEEYQKEAGLDYVFETWFRSPAF